ncbi:MAG: GGDEF domain-containing protein, partial [Cellulomonadaceae bacterium]|nr:GGDEF domain-containing protein [Cellulomonadaceae bacterium]
LVHQIEVIDDLRGELAELASHDALTGLHNRRHMVERFACMVAQAQETGEALAVVLLDVDLFKEVNDRYGHLVGDEVLVALARRIAGQAPERALVARWGGEEFFVAVPGADAAAGLDVAESARRTCQDDPITVAGHTIHCTLSGGVAAYPVSGTTTSALFHAADVSLYEAKRSGRNVVCVHRDAVLS